MKLLITDIHHGNGGGHVTYILGLIQGLRHEYDITLAAPPTGRLYHRASGMDGIRVLPGLYTSRPVPLLREVRRLRAFLRDERFDLVHVNGGADHRHVMFATLGMPRRPAIVWTKHNTNPVGSVGHRLRARMGTHTAIGVSEFVGRSLQASAYRRCPVKVVRNGVDVNHWRPASIAEKRDLRETLFGPLEPGTLVLGSTGGTDYNKGWHLLVQALGRLERPLRERFRVVVAGDPPAAALRGIVEAAEMTPYVRFPGLLADVRTVLGACDLGFVLSFQEAASYACYEAMAMGLPVLLSDAGGLPENVRPGREGWLVPTGNVEALEHALRDIAAHPERLPSMGAMARSRVESAFSVDHFLQGTKKAYKSALAAARGAGVPVSL